MEVPVFSCFSPTICPSVPTVFQGRCFRYVPDTLYEKDKNTTLLYFIAGRSDPGHCSEVRVIMSPQCPESFAQRGTNRDL